MLNRTALIVRPAEPYIAWARSLEEDSEVLPEPTGEQTVYLVPSFEGDDDHRLLLNLVFAEVFERALHGWHTDEAAWPQKRTLKMFRSWFHIEIHTVVEDLCVDPLMDDDDDDYEETVVELK